jgi:hypothetical protein
MPRLRRRAICDQRLRVILTIVQLLDAECSVIGQRHGRHDSTAQSPLKQLIVLAKLNHLMWHLIWSDSRSFAVIFTSG